MLGAAGALALPPWHLVFFLLPAFAGLALVVFRAATVRSAFIAGWWFGVGHGAAGYYWVANAFLVDQARYGFLAPVAVVGLAAGMAVFPGIAAALAHAAHRFRPTSPLGRVLIFAAMWAASEWLRSWVLTGFPWNLMATVWVFSDEMIQGAAYAGAYGLGLITIAVAALPAVFFWHGERRWIALQTGFGALVLVGIWAAGYHRIDALGPDDVDGVRLRLVQPNIAQHLKWKSDLRLGHVRNQLKLSRNPGKGKPPTHVIWPETSVPYNLSGDRPLRSLMATAVPPRGLLITGAPRSEKLSDGTRRVANSLHALNGTGEIIATYDKKHLVPFGEYVPFRNILKFSKLTAGRLDFTPGTGPSIFDLPGLPPFAALICYEVIFPAEVAEVVAGSRPTWLLNITNDAWF
ncbi:MAG: apolipoprotein N-acyltransferase, partial [Rhodospirillaceae bacterium]|nr:apolipoprotein N-acyltransferase [Rhodospirillaceae bacterium]